MQFSFRKPHFWHLQNFAKTLFLHSVTLFVFSKILQNTIKMGKAVKNKLGQVFNTRLGPVLTLETPNLGPVFNSTAYIYIYMYTYIHTYLRTYMCAVESISGPKLPSGVDIWSKFFVCVCVWCSSFVGGCQKLAPHSRAMYHGHLWTQTQQSSWCRGLDHRKCQSGFSVAASPCTLDCMAYQNCSPPPGHMPGKDLACSQTCLS